MIETKQDLTEALQMDREALGISKRRRHPRWLRDSVWRFEIILRKHEYYINNSKKSLLYLLISKWYGLRHERIGCRLGFDIPCNVFGPGLRINHNGYIVVNQNARVGDWCDIHQGVNIGQNIDSGAPVIGNNVWIGPGAKIFGKIEIADGCAIGANAVVNNSFTSPFSTIGGVPAKLIGQKGNPWIKPYK